MINSRTFNIWHFSHLLLDTLHRQITRHHSRHSLTIAHDYLSSLEIFIHDRSSSLDVLVTIIHRFSKHSSRSLIVIRRSRHDYSSFFEKFLTIVHRHSTHSSRSFIISWSIRHDRLLSFETFIYDYSILFTSARHQLKLWKINSSKLAQIFRERILSRF